MQQSGFTLFELLITLAISAIVLLIALPNFNDLMQRSRILTASQELQDAISLSRSTAVSTNSRTVLEAKNNQWHNGWTLFIDTDGDGNLSEKDTTVRVGEKKKGILTEASQPMNSYISFIGTGMSRQKSTSSTGAILAGHIKICPEKKGGGHKLILSGGGRTRLEKLSGSECAQLQAQGLR